MRTILITVKGTRAFAGLETSGRTGDLGCSQFTGSGAGNAGDLQNAALLSIYLASKIQNRRTGNTARAKPGP